MKTIVIFILVIMCLNTSAQMLAIPDHDLVQSSKDIVRGTVLSTKAQWVNNNKFIYTFTKLKIEENISGSYQVGDTVTIVTPGGYDPVKDLGMRVSHQAVFEDQEDVVVFLVKAEGELDAIDYRFLKDDPKLPQNIMRVNGYFQGKRKIFTDPKTKRLMIQKPNEDRSVDFNAHQLKLKQEVKQYKPIISK